MTQEPGTSADDNYAERATSFGRVAAHYEAFRPGPTAAAVEWIFPGRVGRVVDLGAGTGLMTRLLANVADEVIAVDPDPGMRAELAVAVPGVDAREGRGEALPLESATVDAIVASSSWHWVDPVAGLTEAARVLRPGGTMAALWTGPDPEGSFIQQVRAVLADERGPTAGAGSGTLEQTLAGPGVELKLVIPEGLPFSQPEYHRVAWPIALTADELIGLLGTLSAVILLPEQERLELFDRARSLLRQFLGLEGDATIDVEFASDIYRSYRDA